MELIMQRLIHLFVGWKSIIFKKLNDSRQFRDSPVIACIHLFMKIAKDSFNILGRCEGSLDEVNSFRRALHTASAQNLNTQPGIPSELGE